MPKTGRSLIGTVAGFKSEWWPVFDRNAGRLHVGIRNMPTCTTCWWLPCPFPSALELSSRHHE
ncbi:hypothetical protein ELI02_32925 [Rhizobium leguminosarum]|nr:hypothetical protein ELI02_32925 [Rhizobium leguminosarum]